jgi:hypothetical protein
LILKKKRLNLRKKKKLKFKYFKLLRRSTEVTQDNEYQTNISPQYKGY